MGAEQRLPGWRPRPGTSPTSAGRRGGTTATGTDGSPESLRALQLEYGAEIGRAIVNFDGRIVFCVVSRYHGGAFVVLSKTVNDNTDGMSNHVADDRTVSEGRIEPVTIADSRLGTCGGHPAYHAVQRTYPEHWSPATSRSIDTGAGR